MPKLSDEKINLRKKIIIESAFKMFAQKGYSMTTMDDIVKASGISKGGIYNYFKSKEDIFLQIAEDRFEERHQVVKIFRESSTCRQHLLRYLEWVLKGLESDEIEQLSRFTFEFWSVLSHSRNLSEDRYNRFAKDLKDILIEGIKKGEFRENLDVDSMVYIILSSLDGLAHTNSVMGIKMSEDVASEFITMIFKMIDKEV